MDRHKVVMDIPVFSDILQSSQRKVVDGSLLKHYGKGEYLFQIRDVMTNVYVVVSGFAVIERVGRSQEKRAIFLLGKGEILNEVVLEKTQSSVNCYALTDLEILSIPAALLLEIMEEDFLLTKVIFNSMARKLRRMYHQVENTTKMTKLERQVASRLWKMGRDFGIQKSDYLELPFRMTITFLAELVGSNRESVSRVVKELAAEESVSIQKGICRIYSMEKLKNKISKA